MGAWVRPRCCSKASAEPWAWPLVRTVCQHPRHVAAFIAPQYGVVWDLHTTAYTPRGNHWGQTLMENVQKLLQAANPAGA